MFSYRKRANAFQYFDPIYKKLSNYEHKNLCLCVINGYLPAKKSCVHIFLTKFKIQYSDLAIDSDSEK